jgi:ATP-dependent helicase/nuclease subunit A
MAEAAELPPWAHRLPPAEPAPPRPLAPSRPTLAEPAARSPLGIVAGTRDGVGFKRGLLVHRLLQILPELDPVRRRKAAEQFLARPVHGLADAEQAAIAEEILAILAEPDFAALFGPESQAEVPIVGLVGDYAIAGQIDRLVVTTEDVLIIDYKTLRPKPASDDAVPPAYLRQLAAYRAAIAQIYPGRAVKCALLWTDGPHLMPISPALLDRWAP